MRTFFVFVLASILLLPFAAEAQFGPIIPEACRACPCGFGGVLAIIQNVVNFLIGISIIVATIIIVWAGGLYILSATNPESRSTANKMLINAAIGLVIVLSAWLIVDFVMKTLYDSGSEFGPWNSILAGDGEENSCIVAKTTKTPSLFSGNMFTAPGGTEVTGSPGCPTCVSLAEKGLTCKSSASCTLNPAVADRVVALKNSFAGTWTVTEAYPPTVTHTNQCHSRGTCIDAGFRGDTRYTEANIVAFASAASSAGLRAVFETESCEWRDIARRRSITAYCKSDNGYGHITGSHFSLYSN
ncbi:MAG: pilin [Rectinemataceae bacterium]|nr:pilin [Rectinemataceae bacterium]